MSTPIGSRPVAQSVSSSSESDAGVPIVTHSKPLTAHLTLKPREQCVVINGSTYKITVTLGDNPIDVSDQLKQLIEKMGQAFADKNSGFRTADFNINGNPKEIDALITPRDSSSASRTPPKFESYSCENIFINGTQQNGTQERKIRNTFTKIVRNPRPSSTVHPHSKTSSDVDSKGSKGKDRDSSSEAFSKSVGSGSESGSELVLGVNILDLKQARQAALRRKNRLLPQRRSKKTNQL